MASDSRRPVQDDLTELRTSHFRSVVARLGANLIFYSGGLKLLQPRVRGELPFAVLIYHRVNPDRDPFFPSLSVTAFETQMRYLAGTFRVLSLYEIVGRIREGKGVDPCTIAITFDDGYRDNYDCAHPILKKYGLPATLFVPTAYIESGQVLWNDRLAWAVRHTERKQVSFQTPSGNMFFRLRTLHEKLRAFILILEELKSYHEDRKKVVVDSLIQELQKGKRGPTSRMLTWSQLREMAQEGWDIGSHTVNHTILTKIPELEARRELLASKKILENELRRPVRLFAYPNGKQADFNSRIKTLIREAGYEVAVTTLDGFNRSVVDLLEIRRRNPWEEDLPSFAVKMHWSYRRASSSYQG